MNNIGNPSDASSIAEKIIQSLSAPMSIQRDIKCSIGVSIGIAIYPQNGSEIDNLMKAADTAMYECKTNGKNNYHFSKGLADMSGASDSWIRFTSELASNVPEIDLQHENIIFKMDNLNKAINRSENTEMIKRMFDELELLTRDNFETEDVLMDKYEYPEMVDHKRAHQKLLNDLTYLKRKIMKGGESYAMLFLKEWFLSHIQDFDKPLTDFIVKRCIE